MSKHSATATTRCRQTGLASLPSSGPQGGGKCCAGLHHSEDRRPWQPWPDASVSVYPDSLAFRTCPGKEPTLYLELTAC